MTSTNPIVANALRARNDWRTGTYYFGMLIRAKGDMWKYLLSNKPQRARAEFAKFAKAIKGMGPKVEADYRQEMQDFGALLDELERTSTSLPGLSGSDLHKRMRIAHGRWNQPVPKSVFDYETAERARKQAEEDRRRQRGAPTPRADDDYLE